MDSIELRKAIILVINHPPCYRMKMTGHIDSLKFALFVSLLNSLYKGVLCLMRRFSSNERLNAAVAGGLSALSLFVDSKDRRIFFALVLFSRSLVSLYFIILLII